MRKYLKIILLMKRVIDRYLYPIVIIMMDLLKIKFPRRADFIIIGSHGLGRNAFLLFLTYCKVRVNWHHAFDKYYKRCYMYLTLLLFKPKDLKCAMCFAELDVENEQKIIDKINQKLPAIILIRDPISILKTHINLKGIKNNTVITTEIKKIQGEYKITKDSTKTIEDIIVYNDYKDNNLTKSNKPSLDLLHYLIQITSLNKDSKIKEIVLFNSLYQRLKNKIGELVFIDMNELSANNILNTMERLSNKFGFTISDNREFFLHKLYGSMSILIPMHINVDGGGSIIFSNTHQEFKRNKQMKDLTPHFFDFKPMYSIGIYSNMDIQDISNDLAELLKQHINEYYNKALEMVKIIEAQSIKEEDIISYLNEHLELKKQYLQVFEYETSIVNQYAPHITESWTYYNKIKGLDT